jgi:hypothetical protein
MCHLRACVSNQLNHYDYFGQNLILNNPLQFSGNDDDDEDEDEGGFSDAELLVALPTDGSV